MKKIFLSILASFNKCKVYIIIVFLVYCLSCLTGIIMVHTDNNFALSQRDKIVDTANQEDKASINYQKGSQFNATLYDFTGNLFFAGVQTFMGLGIVIPYFTVAYQGWVGGIVSVNNFHKSRLKVLKSALYYVIVLLLQFIAYSMCIGTGIKAGVEIYKQNASISWKLWKYRIKKSNLIDIGNIYFISIPLFFIASLFEYYSSWNI
jgi:hypothetical protein